MDWPWIDQEAGKKRPGRLPCRVADLREFGGDGSCHADHSQIVDKVLRKHIPNIGDVLCGGLWQAARSRVIDMYFPAR